MKSGIWFLVTKADGSSKPVYNIEQFSTHIENKIRAEHSLPLRNHYQSGYTNSRILVSGTSNSVFYSRYNYTSVAAANKLKRINTIRNNIPRKTFGQ